MKIKARSKLLIVIPSRYYIDNGNIWTTTSYNYEMWSECLNIWDEVIVAALCLCSSPPKQSTRADGPSVTFVPLKNSKGTIQAIQTIPNRFITLYKAVKEVDAVVLHVPSDIGTIAFLWAQMLNKPYGLDIRGSQSLDIYYLRLKGVRGARLVATIFARFFAWVRKYARCAIYVSRQLQYLYPISKEAYTSVASDIRIPDWWFSQPRYFREDKQKWNLCSIGRLEEGKGYSILLQACAQLIKQKGHCVTLEIIGTGPLENTLRAQAEELGISDLVIFKGFIEWGPSLQKRLLAADLFVFASVSEGMPRVLLEAMAVGLPIVSTDVGGVSEILSANALVPINDTVALTSKLAALIEDPLQMTTMSQSNFQRIQEFRIERLRPQKQAFYQYLKSQIEHLRNSKELG